MAKTHQSFPSRKPKPEMQAKQKLYLENHTGFQTRPTLRSSHAKKKQDRDAVLEISPSPSYPTSPPLRTTTPTKSQRPIYINNVNSSHHSYRCNPPCPPCKERTKSQETKKKKRKGKKNRFNDKKTSKENPVYKEPGTSRRVNRRCTAAENARNPILRFPSLQLPTKLLCFITLLALLSLCGYGFKI